MSFANYHAETYLIKLTNSIKFLPHQIKLKNNKQWERTLRKLHGANETKQMQTYITAKEPQKHLVPYIADQKFQEADLILEELRMQIQTQLDSNAIENMFFDTQGSAEECEELQLTMNLRYIS